eukprot:TRINITY_DN8155_c0_g1_i2.p1 TRINITY_DN8155_c0_g1~~TRINITY_DN8155_c0_g1_i2.p1  ORF type:complete len:360 (-),score=82.42 TRINITY_DN8155_c0_g1_i2:670-1749(-)
MSAQPPVQYANTSTVCQNAALKACSGDLSQAHRYFCCAMSTYCPSNTEGYGQCCPASSATYYCGSGTCAAGSHMCGASPPPPPPPSSTSTTTSGFPRGLITGSSSSGSSSGSAADLPYLALLAIVVLPIVIGILIYRWYRNAQEKKRMEEEQREWDARTAGEIKKAKRISRVAPAPQPDAEQDDDADQGDEDDVEANRRTAVPPRVRPPADDGYDIMLSYRVSETGEESSGGDESVFRMKSALVAAGYTVFVGEADLQGGEGWMDMIQKALTGCKVFVAVCSPTYGATVWTQREISYVDNLRKPIVPLWYSGKYPPEKVSMILGPLQRVPSRGMVPMVDGDFDEVMEELLSVLRRLIKS